MIGLSPTGVNTARRDFDQLENSPLFMHSPIVAARLNSRLPESLSELSQNLQQKQANVIKNKLTMPYKKRGQDIQHLFTH